MPKFSSSFSEVAGLLFNLDVELDFARIASPEAAGEPRRPTFDRSIDGIEIYGSDESDGGYGPEEDVDEIPTRDRYTLALGAPPIPTPSPPQTHRNSRPLATRRPRLPPRPKPSARHRRDGRDVPAATPAPGRVSKAVTTSAASELAKEYPHSTSTSFDAVPTDDSPRTKLRALAAQTTPEFVGGYYDHLFSLGVKSKPLPRVDVSANLIEAEDRKGMTTMRREGRRLLAESRVDEAEVVREDVAAHFEVESDGNVDSGIFGTTGAPALEKANAAVVNAAKDLERATSDEENRVRTPNSNADGVDASATGLFLDAPITPTVPAAEPSWFHSSSMATMPLPSDELTNSSPEPTLTNDVPAFNGFPVLARTPAPALPRFATPAIASVRVDALVATGAPPSPFVSAAPSSTTILTLRTRTKTHLLRLIVPSAGWTFEDAMRAAPALNYVGMPADVLARVFVNVSEGGCAAVEGADGGSPRVEVLKGFRVGDVADVVGNREVVCCVEFERVERMQWEKV